MLGGNMPFQKCVSAGFVATFITFKDSCAWRTFLDGRYFSLKTVDLAWLDLYTFFNLMILLSSSAVSSCVFVVICLVLIITKSALGAEVFANLWVSLCASTFGAAFCLAQILYMIPKLTISILEMLTVTFFHFHFFFFFSSKIGKTI